jgi:Domain of unknown function (DUF4404)
MTHQELQKTIAELRAELLNLGEANEGHKAHIHQLIDMLEHHLSNPAKDEKTLRENVSSTLEHFEAEHPRMTLILHQIMNMLSGSGI